MIQKIMLSLVGLLWVFQVTPLEAKLKNRLTPSAAERLAAERPNALCTQLFCTEEEKEGAICDNNTFSNVIVCKLLSDFFPPQEEEDTFYACRLTPQGGTCTYPDEIPWWKKAIYIARDWTDTLHGAAHYLSSALSYYDPETLKVISLFFSFAAQQMGYEISPEQFSVFIQTLQQSLHLMASGLKVLHEALLLFPLSQEKSAAWWKVGMAAPEEDLLPLWDAQAQESVPPAVEVS